MVSIPFKREGVSKASLVSPTPFRNNVSIPFKREGVSKVTSVLFPMRGSRKVFQFPSNGKVYPKCFRFLRKRINLPYVSIPFKREGVSKASFHLISPIPHLIGVSIPFKREGVSKAPLAGMIQKQNVTVFQFPSNGKVYPKSFQMDGKNI